MSHFILLCMYINIYICIHPQRDSEKCFQKLIDDTQLKFPGLPLFPSYHGEARLHGARLQHFAQLALSQRDALVQWEYPKSSKSWMIIFR